MNVRKGLHVLPGMVLTGLCACTVGLTVHVQNVSFSLSHQRRTDEGSHWQLCLGTMCFAFVHIEWVSVSPRLADY